MAFTSHVGGGVQHRCAEWKTISSHWRRSWGLILGMSLETLGATREETLGATRQAALSRLPHDKRLVSATSCQPVLAEMKLPFSALSLSLFWGKVSYFGAALPRCRQLCLCRQIAQRVHQVPEQRNMAQNIMSKGGTQFELCKRFIQVNPLKTLINNTEIQYSPTRIAERIW